MPLTSYVDVCVLRQLNVSVLVLCAHGWRSLSRNKGAMPQNLVSCKLAGWDRARQFRFQAQRRGQPCPKACSDSGSAEEMGCSGDSASLLGGCGEDRADQVLDGSLPGGREVSPGRCLSRCCRRSAARELRGAGGSRAWLGAKWPEQSSHHGPWCCELLGSGPSLRSQGCERSRSAWTRFRHAHHPHLALCPVCAPVCVHARPISEPPLPDQCISGSDLGFIFRLPDDSTCKGENGEKEQSVSRKQATEPEPGGLIPPGGKVAVVIVCDAKYVARGFGEFALGTFVRLSV